MCYTFSCCVDEVAASHVDADAMVHYGYACMSKYALFGLLMDNITYHAIQGTIGCP
jgi:diphthamide biosynthesis enzyme Dph1/Dph2-like protein